MPATLLIDDGSSRPDSTLALRDLAQALGRRTGAAVHPVSLLHADRIPAAALDGRPADTLEPYLRRALASGERAFHLIPLLFGPSRALSRFIPDLVADLRRVHGPFQVRIAPELCPLPRGEPRLADLLDDHIRATAAARAIAPRRLVLVDHGSPIPQVTAVRTWLAQRVRERIDPGAVLTEAAMERRPGPEYDFNGDLLDLVLHRLAAADPTTPVIVAMLFLAPGRHAGPGGDIAAICAAAQADFPGFQAHPTPLVGSHPALIEILADRLTGAAEQL